MTTPADVRTLVQSVHDSPGLAVVALAGAGTQALSWVLGVSGASRTLLEAVVPYAERSMVDLVGRDPGQFVSDDTAREMARRCYERALGLGEGAQPVLGLACTATIATDRPKRGQHRCHVATWDEAGVECLSLVLAKGQRDRAGEEEVVSRLVLSALAGVSGIDRAPDRDAFLGLLDSEQVLADYGDHPGPVASLLDPAGGVSRLVVEQDGRMREGAPVPGAVLAGSFRPLHDGHTELASVAAETLGMPVTFELSVTNVDKPPLQGREVLRRVRQFGDVGPVVLTRAPTFREKAELLPGCTFVIGWDTAVRLVHPRYYGDDPRAMVLALSRIRDLGCRFLVAGRTDGDTFRTVEDVAVPPELAGLLEGLPESRFRKDVSSTELRSV
ncbi:MAG: hypothetical protein J4F43_05785 [Dehalococcoidia bacterium]|nr:hypothetical protein [Dehalococcoidia bacterium]